MDSCITRSFHFDHFLDNLRKQGYIVKKGKYIAVRPPGKERFVRLKTLGDSYSEDTIRKRIREHEQTPLYHRLPPPHKQRKAVSGKVQKITGFRALYYRYLYLLRKWRNPSAPPRKRRYNMAEIIKFDRYVEQARLLMKHRIDTESQLQTLKMALENEIGILTEQRKGFYQQKYKTSGNEEISLRIVSINLSIKMYRRELRICTQIEADIPTVRKTIHTPVIEVPEKKKQPKYRQPHAHHR